MRVRTAATAAVGVGAAVTVLAVVLPGVRFAYRQPTLHVIFETAEGLVALLLAYLAYGRYRLERLTSDYVLAQALALFAATNVIASAIPRAALGGHGQALSAWGALGLRLAAAALFAAGAWAPTRATRRDLRVTHLLGVVAALLAATTAVVLALSDRLPAGVNPAEVDARIPTLDSPLLVAAQFVSAALFAAAAAGFARQPVVDGDELPLWLSVASVVSVFARLNYALFPSLYSGWVYTGDILRLGFYVLLLVGAAREIRRYWATAATTAMLEERRRVARELHDGLAQELAFLATQSTRLARGADVDPETLSRTAERALDESRRAIAALTRDVDEPLETTLAQAAQEVARRAGADVRCELEAVGRIPPDVREQLVRVVREAVSNAVRHGAARSITLSVRRTPHLSVTVSDDGIGFEVEQPSHAGFGLISMRERVEAVGGRLRLRSSPGRGTAVEVEVEVESA